MADLERRVLGRTGLEVSVLGYGAMELRNADHPRARPVEPRQAALVLNHALDRGINLIDTAPDYGDSEDNIGRAIAHRRAEFVLASKCGCPLDGPHPDPRSVPHVFTPENITAGVERSLQRMRTDHLDIVQFHGNPARAVIEEDAAVATLIDLREQGKIRFLGASSSLPNLPDLIDMDVFDVFQVPYSALGREHEEAMTRAAATGAGVIVRGRVAARVAATASEDAAAQESAASLTELAGTEPLMEFLIRFALAHPATSTSIMGTINLDHLDQNVAAAARGPLPPDVYAEAKRRLDAIERTHATTNQGPVG